MAKDSLIGNCSRLKGIVVSVGMRGMRKMKTCCPWYWPRAIMASMTLCLSSWMISFVPLQSLGASRLRRRITGTPFFRRSICGGKPGGSRELRSSVGKSTAPSSSTGVSIEGYSLSSVGIWSRRESLIVAIASFVGARIARFDSQLWSVKLAARSGKTAFSSCSGE